MGYGVKHKEFVLRFFKNHSQTTYTILWQYFVSPFSGKFLFQVIQEASISPISDYCRSTSCLRKMNNVLLQQSNIIYFFWLLLLYVAMCFHLDLSTQMISLLKMPTYALCISIEKLTTHEAVFKIQAKSIQTFSHKQLNENSTVAHLWKKCCTAETVPAWFLCLLPFQEYGKSYKPEVSFIFNWSFILCL